MADWMGKGASMPPDAKDAMSEGATPSPAKVAVSVGGEVRGAGAVQRTRGGPTWGEPTRGAGWSWWCAQRKPHGRERSQGS